MGNRHDILFHNAITHRAPMSDVAHRTAFPPPDKKNDSKRLAKAVERASEEFAA